jgi:hypothetical protein
MNLCDVLWLWLTHSVLSPLLLLMPLLLLVLNLLFPLCLLHVSTTVRNEYASLLASSNFSW